MKRPKAKTLKTKTKFKLTCLRTVYPPISNQEAVWLQEDKEVEAEIRQSDFYIIGAREEAKFKNFDPIKLEGGIIEFDFCIGEERTSKFHIDVQKLPTICDLEEFDLEIEIGEKIIRIWNGEIGGESSEVLEWFTTEKLLWDVGRGRQGIVSSKYISDLASYEVLYVGIAKKGDSFDRLLQRGHKARQEILANEKQRHSGARVTDETFLFFFRAEPTIATTFDSSHNFKVEDFTGTIDIKRIVADAEKAFVSHLNPTYNKEKFKRYPSGIDGLVDSGIDRYGYAIGEKLKFHSNTQVFSGDWDCKKASVGQKADAIFVEGDEVSIFNACEVLDTFSLNIIEQGRITIIDC